MTRRRTRARSRGEGVRGSRPRIPLARQLIGASPSREVFAGGPCPGTPRNIRTAPEAGFNRRTRGRLHARRCFAKGPEGACRPAPDDEAQLAAMVETTCEEAGTPIACAAAGVRLLGKAPNDPKVMERLEKACDGDEPWACNSLATIYRVRGAGQAPDGEQAEVLNNLACDEGFLPACRDLGAMYLNGDGVERDEAKGLAYVKKSCRPDATTFCPDLLFFCAMGLKGACE